METQKSDSGANFNLQTSKDMLETTHDRYSDGSRRIATWALVSMISSASGSSEEPAKLGDVPHIE